MTEQEATRWLKVWSATHQNENDNIREAVWVAINALEKQIPKKPITKPWSPALCPTCRCELSESVGDGYYKHYSHLKVCDCGQKLNWEEV